MFDTMTYKEFVEATKLPISFEISISDKSLEVWRTPHLLDKREYDNKPKDFSMSKNKYSIIISKIIDKIQDNKAYSIYWDANGKNNVLSLEKKGFKIYIFGVILNSKLNKTQLYKKAVNRIDIGTINFKGDQ